MSLAEITPLLFLSDISWHALYQRPQHLAAGLAQHGPVLWVEPATLGHPVTWKPEPIAPNLHRVTVPLFPHNARNRVVRSLAAPVAGISAARRLVEMTQLRITVRALQSLGLPVRGDSILIENFQLIHLARSLQPSRLVFDYIDDAFGFADMPAYVRALWTETVGASTAVSVTAVRLREQVAAGHRGPVHLIRNGVEYRRFADDTSPRPPDLPADGRPIVCYVGSVYPWFDFELVTAAARQFPDTHFVIVGPGHPDVARSIEQLGLHPNVRVLGPRPYTSVPAYLRYATVGIIPFRRTPLTEAVNPVKLYEYSAAGIPTVTTLFADDLNEFAGIVHFARSTGEFTTAVAAALASATDPATRARLQTFASHHDWKARVESLRALL
jgi:glycosyltransferase involved in cell wall biosynthesis